MELTRAEYNQLKAFPGGDTAELLDLLIGEKDRLLLEAPTRETREEIQALCEKWGFVYWDPTEKIPNYDGTHVVVAETEDAAEAFFDIPENKEPYNHRGELLGYPSCCVQAYSEPYSGFRTETPEDATDFRKYPFHLNRFPRLRWTRKLLSHYPCHYECDASLEIGQRRLELLKEYDPDRAASVQHYLSSFILAVKDRGVVFAPEYDCEETETGYRVRHHGVTAARPDTDDEFLSLVNQSSFLTVESHNHVSVKGTTFTGNDVLALCFADPVTLP